MRMADVARGAKGLGFMLWKGVARGQRVSIGIGGVALLSLVLSSLQLEESKIGLLGFVTRGGGRGPPGGPALPLAILFRAFRLR